MTNALSTVVCTEFGEHLTTNAGYAMADARELAERVDSPVGVWARDGWYTVCDVALDLIEPNPELSGWRLRAVCDTER